MSLSVRAPTRIDFGGGWTDVPPYCEREGGFVCNVAMNRYAIATVSEGPLIPDPREWRLIGAAVRRAGLTGVNVSVASDYPIGAGLGGSSAASAAILGALDAWQQRAWNRDGIAERGRRIEVEDLGVPGGRQDHYAAVYGGALALRFSDRVDVRQLAVSDATRAALERRLVLVYTGESRISGDTIQAVLGAYEAGDPRVVSALAHMRMLAEQMADALDRGDIDTLGALVGESWTHQRALHHAISTPLIDEIVMTALKAGARGAKALGASGGGTVLAVAGDDNVEEVLRAVEPLGALVPFALDFEGLKQVER